MKKLFLAVLIAALAFLLCSCGEHTVVSVDGIDNCNLEYDSDFELGLYLIPEGFLEKYVYLDVDYHFRARAVYLPFFSERETMVLSVTYTTDIYTQAKEYCLKEMELSETHKIEYNGYTFIDNIELVTKLTDYGYPRWSNMLVYNDNLKCLIFLGFYDGDYLKDGLDDWEKVKEKG